MRLSCALLVGYELLTSGCLSFMARRGQDLSPLITREQVHQEFGEPTFAETVDGTPYEEFQTQRKICEYRRAISIGMGGVMSWGLIELIAFPDEHYRNEQRLFLGQTLRFQYNQSGNVTKVYLNGEYLLSPNDSKIPQ
jgi:hypothetical protein